ncbi:hypothetical protein ABK040_016084 [Willaertia magna]
MSEEKLINDGEEEPFLQQIDNDEMSDISNIEYFLKDTDFEEREETNNHSFISTNTLSSFHNNTDDISSIQLLSSPNLKNSLLKQVFHKQQQHVVEEINYNNNSYCNSNATVDSSQRRKPNHNPSHQSTLSHSSSMPNLHATKMDSTFHKPTLSIDLGNMLYNIHNNNNSSGFRELTTFEEDLTSTHLHNDVNNGVFNNVNNNVEHAMSSSPIMAVSSPNNTNLTTCCINSNLNSIQQSSQLGSKHTTNGSHHNNNSEIYQLIDHALQGVTSSLGLKLVGDNNISNNKTNNLLNVPPSRSRTLSAPVAFNHNHHQMINNNQQVISLKNANSPMSFNQQQQQQQYESGTSLLASQQQSQQQTLFQQQQPPHLIFLPQQQVVNNNNIVMEGKEGNDAINNFQHPHTKSTSFDFAILNNNGNNANNTNNNSNHHLGHFVMNKNSLGQRRTTNSGFIEQQQHHHVILNQPASTLNTYVMNVSNNNVLGNHHQVIHPFPTDIQRHYSSPAIFEHYNVIAGVNVGGYNNNVNSSPSTVVGVNNYSPTTGVSMNNMVTNNSPIQFNNMNNNMVVPMPMNNNATTMTVVSPNNIVPTSAGSGNNSSTKSTKSKVKVARSNSISQTANSPASNGTNSSSQRSNSPKTTTFHLMNVNESGDVVIGSSSTLTAAALLSKRGGNNLQRKNRRNSCPSIKEANGDSNEKNLPSSPKSLSKNNNKMQQSLNKTIVFNNLYDEIQFKKKYGPNSTFYKFK